MILPVGGAVKGGEEIPRSLQVEFQQRVTNLDESAMRVGVCAYTPVERIRREIISIKETGSAAQKTRFPYQSRRLPIELPLRVTKRRHVDSEQVLQPLLAILNLRPSLLFLQRS